jgi:predicted dehydrogenase
MRTAVVGVGYLGNFHAQKYKALSSGAEPLCQFVAVCDLNENQVNKVAGDLGVKAVTRPQDLIGLVDAVTIATITPTHFELAKLFLENGIHVNVEKPICLKTSEAEILVQLAEKKNLTLCVGHSERYNPAYQELCKSIKNPEFIEFNRYAPFKLRGSDVSVLHDLMIHDIDLMLAMDSTPYQLVSAQAGKMVTKTYDWCSASFRFDSGLFCQINSSRLAKEMIRAVRAIDQQTIWIANLQTGDLDKTFAVDHPEHPVGMSVVNVGRGDNLLTETEAFLKSIKKIKTTAVTGRDGMKALKVVDQIIAHLGSQT